MGSNQMAILNQLASSHAENMAYSRFFNNGPVSKDTLIESSQRKVKEVSQGKHVLCLQDSVAHTTIIGDRESDIYQEFIVLKDAHTDLLIRSREDRRLHGEEKHLSAQPTTGSYKISVRGDGKGIKARASLVPNHIKRGLDKFNLMFQELVLSNRYRDVYKE